MLLHNPPGEGNPSAGEPEHTATLERPEPAQPLAAVLRVDNAPATPSSFVLRAGSCRIGGGAGCDLVIEDSTVSRLHAELSLTPEGVAVRDLGSRNGTFVYGQRIEQAVLSLGTPLQLGRAVVHIDPEPLEPVSPLADGVTQYGALHGGSRAMRHLFAILTRLEGSRVNVLIEGETGTGKDLVARALHERSPLASGPFVVVNCAALDRNLVRSELFGHRRGAFTGAIDDHGGVFQAASGGSLFLDEIGELPLEVQPILLRALESGAITRMGEAKERKIDVRVIAATHRHLEQEVAERRFREDLFYRLSVVRVKMPALRDHVEDIEGLAEHFARTQGLPALPAQVLGQLRARSWRGNVRELRSAVAAYAALGTLPEAHHLQGTPLEVLVRGAIDLSQPYAEQKEQLLEAFTRTYVQLLLAATGDNRSEAARISGLERSYLNKLANRLNGSG